MIPRPILAAVPGAALLAFACALPPAEVNEQGGGGSGGAPGGGGSGGGGPACGVAFDPTDAFCESCAEAYCCGELQACTKGTSCYALAECLTQYCTGSQDPNCGNTYCSAHAAGAAAAQALVSCVCNYSCPSECGASCAS